MTPKHPSTERAFYVFKKIFPAFFAPSAISLPRYTRRSASQRSNALAKTGVLFQPSVSRCQFARVPLMLLVSLSAICLWPVG